MFSDPAITESIKQLPEQFETSLPPTILPGTTPGTFENYIKRGILPGKRTADGTWVIRKEDFLLFLQKNNTLNLHE